MKGKLKWKIFLSLRRKRWKRKRKFEENSIKQKILMATISFERMQLICTKISK